MWLGGFSIDLSLPVLVLEVLIHWVGRRLTYLVCFFCALVGLWPYDWYEISALGAQTKRTRRFTLVAVQAINS